MERFPSTGSPTLLLVPTDAEARRLEAAGGFEPGLALRALCGFGPIAAAARTAQTIAAVRPARVVLAGIAGTYDPARLAIGAAACFDAVVVDGIGAGSGEHALGATALGFAQWPGGLGTRSTRIDERIELARSGAEAGARGALLVTACSASATTAEAAARARRHPGALAEDMEGFGVALACALEGVPLAIVRGISNAAGDRDRAAWRIDAALDAARRLVLEVLGAR